MKTAILLLIIFISFTSYTQIVRTTGKATEKSTEVFTKESDGFTKISYVANGSTIQEFINYEKSVTFFVKNVTFYEDKIFYRVIDTYNNLFGITFTFKDRSFFLSDIDGNFIEIRGEGLTFCHQY